MKTHKERHRKHRLGRRAEQRITSVNKLLNSNGINLSDSIVV
jgi:hypothetical protein